MKYDDIIYPKKCHVFSIFLAFLYCLAVPPYHHHRLTDTLCHITSPLSPTGAHNGFGQRYRLACGSKQDGRMFR